MCRGRVVRAPLSMDAQAVPAGMKKKFAVTQDNMKSHASSISTSCSAARRRRFE